MYIIDDLRVKMLIDNDIIELEEIVINIAEKKAYIESCDIDISIKVRQREDYVYRNVYAK